MSALTASFLADCWAPLASDAAHLASRNAVATTDVLTVVQNRDVLQRRSHVYSNCVSKEGKCTTQKSSGRCWMFAMCNVMRVELMKKFKLPADFELSQGFLFFYDKLERGNYFLESVIATRDLDVGDRLVRHLNSYALTLTAAPGRAHCCTCTHAPIEPRPRCRNRRGSAGVWCYLPKT
jgi:aminopeptidase C